MKEKVKVKGKGSLHFYFIIILHFCVWWLDERWWRVKHCV